MIGKLFKGVLLAFGAVILLLLVAVFIPIKPTVDPIQPRESTRYWTMDGGYKIAYTRVSPLAASKPPVIFLHGGPGGYIHSSVIDALSGLTDQGYEVYFYDQSGTGLSERRQRPKATSFASHVADLHEIITDLLDADQAILIGHSAGALIASHYASEYPARVAALVLGAPARIEPLLFSESGQWLNAEKYPVPEHLEFRNTYETYREDTSVSNLPLRAIASIAIAQLFDVKLASDNELDAALNTMASGFTRNMVCDLGNVQPEEGGGGAYSRTGTNFFPDDFDDHRDKMRNSEIPVLVLHGECDFLEYAAVYEYVDLFPMARYQFVEGAGHTIWWDQPELYLSLIGEFLDRSTDRQER